MLIAAAGFYYWKKHQPTPLPPGMMVALPMNLLSGGNTPIESMPHALQYLVRILPSTHYVSFAQAILYRGAGIDIVWPSFAAVAGIGTVFFAVAIIRFRRALALS